MLPNGDARKLGADKDWLAGCRNRDIVHVNFAGGLGQLRHIIAIQRAVLFAGFKRVFKAPKLPQGRDPQRLFVQCSAHHPRQIAIEGCQLAKFV